MHQIWRLRNGDCRFNGLGSMAPALVEHSCDIAFTVILGRRSWGTLYEPQSRQLNRMDIAFKKVVSVRLGQLRATDEIIKPA
jgi:hypothetical protein